MSDPLVGKIVADRFEILERIGDGGTGVVYKAKQLSVDRIIAVKVLGAHVSTDPQWMKRFQNEARAACKLEHPNTVRVLDFGQTREGLLFIAMEYLNGHSLRAEIERHGRLTSTRALQIIAQISASLQEAHTQGIIHRDIKPDNVFLVDLKGGGDMVKVLDFSVAKTDAPDAQLTRAGVVFGTPAYMSPEQGRGVPLSPASDLYAVGIVAYELLMGHPPFSAAIPTDVVLMHLRNTPPPLSGVPSRIAQLVMRCLDKDPKRRPASAAELEQLCQKLLIETSGGMPAARHSSGASPVIDAPSNYPPRTQALPSGGMPAPSPHQGQSAQGGHPGGTMVLPEGGLLPSDAGRLPAAPQPGWSGEGANGGHPVQARYYDGETHGTKLPNPRPAGALFWIAWVLLGLGGGLAAHLWMRAAG